MRTAFTCPSSSLHFPLSPILFPPPPLLTLFLWFFSFQHSPDHCKKAIPDAPKILDATSRAPDCLNIVLWRWRKGRQQRDGCRVKKEAGVIFLVIWNGLKKEMGEPLLAPAGENLEHNTLVAAQPNLNADGAFRLPPSIGLVD